jgi:hypothetical protein
MSLNDRVYSTTAENHDTGWDDSLEQIMCELGDEAQINAYLHKKAHEYYTVQNLKYQLPIIILSAVSGTGNFVSSYFPDYTTVIILTVGGVSIITSIISSVAQFLKVSQLSESHRISYLSWEKFHSQIKFELNKRRSKRETIQDFLSLIIPEYQRLKEISANIPKHISDNLRKSKKNLKDMIVPYMLNGFHPVRPYIETLENNDIENDNGLIVVNGIHNDNNSSADTIV